MVNGYSGLQQGQYHARSRMIAQRKWREREELHIGTDHAAENITGLSQNLETVVIFYPFRFRRRRQGELPKLWELIPFLWENLTADLKKKTRNSRWRVSPIMKSMTSRRQNKWSPRSSSHYWKMVVQRPTQTPPANHSSLITSGQKVHWTFLARV